MSKKLQLRGGTTTEHASFTGAVREVTVDTDKDTLVIHDGSTAGGFALPRTDAEIRTAVEAATDSNVFTDADHTKLNAIEAAATADQTDAEIRTAVEAATDSNVFTDADHTKLNAIEAAATADQTKADIDALNINADLLDGQHGAYYTGYTDTAVAGIVDSSPAALNTLNELAAALGDDANYATTTATSIGTKLPKSGGAMTGAITTNSTFDGRNVSVDGAKLDGIEAGANVTDTANVVAALTAGSNITISAGGTIAGAAQYTHPTHAGDDAAIDTGALSGATVISDLDLNITTDTLGHVTDANATVSTRNLTLANLGYTGETNATADQTITAGSGLSGGGTGNVTLSHSDTSSQGSVNNSGTTFIQDITLDTYGHITGLASVAVPAGAQILSSWNPLATPAHNYTSSTTWSKPSSGYSDSTWVIFYLVGGGQGGSHASSGGPNRGGSATVIAGTMGDLPSSVSVVVGAGGAGSSANTYGNAGGDTTISSNSITFTAKGGNPSVSSPPVELVFADVGNPFGTSLPSELTLVAGDISPVSVVFAGRRSTYGGGFGGDTNPNHPSSSGLSIGGTSTYAGAGGGGRYFAAPTNGSAPGGGGGGSYTNRSFTSGSGGNGSVRIYYIT